MGAHITKDMKNRLNNTVTTLIGTDATVTGDLVFKQGCHVAGIVRGDVTASTGKKTELTVAPTGRVEGNAQAGRMLIQGTVVGNLRCNGTITLASTARVQGSIEYGQIEIEKGAVIKGNLTMPSPETSRGASPTSMPQARPDPAKQVRHAVS